MIVEDIRALHRNYIIYHIIRNGADIESVEFTVSDFDEEQR
jgi:hypothetical protein